MGHDIAGVLVWDVERCDEEEKVREITVRANSENGNGDGDRDMKDGTVQPIRNHYVR